TAARYEVFLPTGATSWSVVRFSLTFVPFLRTSFGFDPGDRWSAHRRRRNEPPREIGPRSDCNLPTCKSSRFSSSAAPEQRYSARELRADSRARWSNTLCRYLSPCGCRKVSGIGLADSLQHRAY